MKSNRKSPISAAAVPKHHRVVLARVTVPTSKVEPLRTATSRLISLKPLTDLPSSYPPWPRLIELYWLTAVLDSAGHPFPKWVWRLLPTPNLMPILEEHAAVYLFRRMEPREALFAIHSGVRVRGFQPIRWPDIFADEDEQDLETFGAALDLDDQISARDDKFDHDAPVLIPKRIRTVEEALLVGLTLAGQCRWPLAAPLTRLLPKYWAKARVSLETANVIVRPIGLSALELAVAGAHIEGVTSSDIDRVLRLTGEKAAGMRATLSLRQLFGQIARTDTAQHAADYYLPQMGRILQLGDSSGIHRIGVFELLKSIQGDACAPRTHKAKGFSHPPDFGLPSSIQASTLLNDAHNPAEIAPRPVAAANPSPTPAMQPQHETTRPGVRPIPRKVPQNQGEWP